MLAFGPPERHPLVEAFFATEVPAPLRPLLGIHGEDPMLRFFLRQGHGLRDQALLSYFRTGWSAHRAVRQILAWRFGDAGATPAVLDFASGYGRASRYLAAELGPGRVTVADVLAEAVDFQRRTFGVAGLVSCHEPAALPAGPTFPFIVATSLFSHLPPARFTPWLAALLGRLAPGGVLAFSVHDRAVLLPGRTFPESGIHHEAMTEIDQLAREEYGATWVDEGYVRSAVAAAGGDRFALHRVPRALWFQQDLYVAVPREADLPPPAFRHEPVGYLGEGSLDDPRALALEGWAIDPGGHAPAGVEVRLGGWVADRQRAELARSDVAAALGDRRFLASGWRSVAQAPDGAAVDSRDLLQLRVVSAGGESATVHLDTVGGTFLGLALARREAAGEASAEELRQLQRRLGGLREQLGAAHWAARRAEQEAGELRQRIAAMEASRFWRARQRWFRFKRALGLTREG